MKTWNMKTVLKCVTNVFLLFNFHVAWPAAAVLALLMLVILHMSGIKRDGFDLDDSAGLLLSDTEDRSLSNHRHLFNIYDVQSSLLERFKLIDISSVKKLKNWKDLYNYNCTVSKSVPSFKICVYQPERDIFISAGLLSSGIWEPHITRAFQTALSRFPQATVIDVGANIGYYSLLSSAMGHKVIAIEPEEESIKRFVAGICADQWNENIVLLANALSDSHKNVSLTRNADNQGGIRVLDNCQRSSWIFGKNDFHSASTECNVPTLTLNDLLYLVTTRVAVIKVDIGRY